MRSILPLVLLLCACGGPADTFAPVVKPLMEAVYASGFVVSGQEYQVFSQADGTLKEVLAPEGSPVKKGEPILLIQGVQSSARYVIAREAYEQARKNREPVLRDLSAVLESARSRMEFDSLNFVRYENLMKANATKRVEFDRAEVQYRNSRNDYVAARNRLVKAQNDVEASIRSAYNQMQIAAEEAGNYTVRSDIDGVVLQISRERGELIRRSEPIAVVGRPESFYLRLSVDELDAHRVKAGQDALIRIDAYAKDIFNGKVTKVYPLVDTRQQSLRVDVALPPDLSGLISGMAAEVNIVIKQRDTAIVIPKHALLTGDSVWTVTDKGRKKVKVGVGIETLDEVEITDGITAQTLLTY